MKKIYYLIGLLVLIPMGLVSCSEDEVLTETGTQSEPALQVNTEEKALETHSKLIEGFKQSATRGETSIYPDYYGGCFINDQKQLVVLTKNEGGQAQMMSMAANAGNLVFKPCEYSYNYLNQVMDELNDYQIKNDNDISNNFLCYYLCDSLNIVIVEMQECSPNKIEEFKRNVSSSPAIQFEQASPATEEENYVSIDTNSLTRAASDLYPGCRIFSYLTSGGITYASNGTLGYRVTCDGAKGFITAGHVVIALGKSVMNNSGLEIGMCDLFDYYDGGTVDAAFVKVDDPVILNSLINNMGGSGLELSTNIVDESDVVAGVFVIKEGAVTGSSTGIISSTNTSIRDTDAQKLITKQIDTTLFAQGGDSGGPVALLSNRDVVGIMKAIRKSNSNTVCTLASEIKKKFYCERY